MTADDLNTPCPHGRSIVTCGACLDAAVDEEAALVEIEGSLDATSGHATLTVEHIDHPGEYGDCLGSLCHTCGCCLHCADDDHCQGCPDRRCECAP